MHPLRQVLPPFLKLIVSVLYLQIPLFTLLAYNCLHSLLLWSRCEAFQNRASWILHKIVFALKSLFIVMAGYGLKFNVLGYTTTHLVIQYRLVATLKHLHSRSVQQHRGNLLKITNPRLVAILCLSSPTLCQYLLLIVWSFQHVYKYNYCHQVINKNLNELSKSQCNNI